MRLTWKKTWCKPDFKWQGGRHLWHTVVLGAGVLAGEESQLWHLILCSAPGPRLRLLGGYRSCVISPSPRGWEGSSAEAIACLMAGTVLQRAKQQRSCLWSKLKPALQLLGKTVQIQLCSPLLLDYWSQLLFHCQHLLTPHLGGGCKAFPLLKPVCPGVSALPLPCRVWVAQLGG